MDAAASTSNGYWIMLQGLSLIPIFHYMLAAVTVLIWFLYNFLECHFLQDLFSGFLGSPVEFTYNSSSKLYDAIVSKCCVLQGTYSTTPWLSSPHLQTVFLNFFAGPPVFKYTRQLFITPDGGTLGLDWLTSSDVSDRALNVDDVDESTPIVVVIPGLTSDSSSVYLKHLAYNTAKSGWKVVIINHRGLGGIPITSDCFYNSGWTEDTRTVVSYVHKENPRAPLFIVGTSVGANILVKYLGEEGENTPVAVAVAVCSPWDLLILDRFISRSRVQKFYDKALTVGLQDYAKLHQPHFYRLANWEGIEKSLSIRDFDDHATRVVGKYEVHVAPQDLLLIHTINVAAVLFMCNLYRFHFSVLVLWMIPFVLGKPFLGMNAGANKNIVLATVKHGGHLAFFEGITASGLWWVRAANEFLGVLHSSHYMHEQNKISTPITLLDSSIDQGPYINVTENGMVAAMNNEPTADNWKKCM